MHPAHCAGQHSPDNVCGRLRRHGVRGVDILQSRNAGLGDLKIGGEIVGDSRARPESSQSSTRSRCRGGRGHVGGLPTGPAPWWAPALHRAETSLPHTEHGRHPSFANHDEPSNPGRPPIIWRSTCDLRPATARQPWWRCASWATQLGMGHHRMWGPAGAAWGVQECGCCPVGWPGGSVLKPAGDVPSSSGWAAGPGCDCVSRVWPMVSGAVECRRRTRVTDGDTSMKVCLI